MARPKPFQYGTLLRIRRRQEDLRALAFAEAQRRVHLAETRLSSIEHEQVRILEDASNRASGPFHAGEVGAFYQYERHLASEADRTTEEITRLQTMAETRRMELEDAMKRRRMIERLEERQKKVFNQAVEKEAQQAADEVANNYSARERAMQRSASLLRERDAMDRSGRGTSL